MNGGEGFPNLKEISGITAAVLAITAGHIAMIKEVYGPPDGPANPVERFNPNKKAELIHEYEGGRNSDDFILRQTLNDGTVVIVKKPVFVGETAVHEPGDIVIPNKLEKPLP